MDRPSWTAPLCVCAPLSLLPGSPLLVVLISQTPQVSSSFIHTEDVMSSFGAEIGEATPGFPSGN